MTETTRLRFAILLGFIVATAASLAAPAHAARVRDIRWGDHGDFSRCVVEFDSSPGRAVLENRTGDLRMLYCDLYSTDGNPTKGVQSVDDPNIRSIRAVYLPGEKRLRLAVKVERPARTKLLTLDSPGRVVIDFFWDRSASPASGASGSGAKSASTSPSTSVSGSASQVIQYKPYTWTETSSDTALSGGSVWSGASRGMTPPWVQSPSSGLTPGGGIDQTSASPFASPTASSASTLPPPDSSSSRAAPASPRSRKPIVVLDPGHGGYHKGAVANVNGKTVYEKDITMAVALKTKAVLESRGQVEVRLTRTKDVYIGLFERTQIAERLDGDLFVSIHCNSTDDRAAARRARGVEFWYWNSNSATSAAAKYLEKLENDEGHADGIGDAAPGTRRLIGSLMADQLESMALRSAEVCDVFNAAFKKVSYFREHNRGVKSARFKVLETYQMPSVLIEIGFLSHPTESRNLVSSDFQQTTARALADAIERTASTLKE